VTAGFSAFVLVLTALGLRRLARALSHNVERTRELEQVKNVALIEGQERERRRISLELHDDIGQKLTALGWRVAGGAGPEDLSRSVREVAQQVSRLSGGLSNMLVQEVGLANALRQLVEDADRLHMSGAKFQLEVSGEAAPGLNQQLCTAIYRVGQEAMANIIKHARAQNVKYRLSFERHRVGLVAEDDGVGVPADTVAAGLGLKSMRARAEAFGGKLQIGPGGSGRGTRVEMEIPLGGENESTLG
jgi:signal transduction histidine kinase